MRGPGESVTMYVCCPCWQDMQRETPCMCFRGWHGVGGPPFVHRLTTHPQHVLSTFSTSENMSVFCIPW